MAIFTVVSLGSHHLAAQPPFPHGGFGQSPDPYFYGAPTLPFSSQGPGYFGYGYGVPQSILLKRELIAAPPVAPAKLRFMHRRNETLRVEVYDRSMKQTILRQDIPAGGTAEVLLPRDAGGFVKETYQTFGPFGEPFIRERVRPLPTSIRYDVIVNQWQIQSIAIDRTGKSPSAIEDVQFQGRGLGRFTLPPGDRLIDGQIDIYRTAMAAGNSGLVAPIQPPLESDGPSSDPLRQAIEELNAR